ncbi:MAG TPA: hypothetical protein VKQ36_05515, partial [Ktedonobacterales bacterium]|nr:hypothetical protein [Ktedonobacterales bacterium]
LNYYPVTDNAIDHLAVNGYSIERLIQALLQPSLPARPEGQLLADYEIEIQMATIALQSIFPQNIATIPTKKIITDLRIRC